MAWVKINYSVNQSHRTEPGPAQHVKKRYRLAQDRIQCQLILSLPQYKGQTIEYIVHSQAALQHIWVCLGSGRLFLTVVLECRVDIAGKRSTH